MNVLVIIAALIIFAFFIARVVKNRNPEAERCARELIVFLRNNKSATAEELAQELERVVGNSTLNGVADIDTLTRSINARLVQAHIPREDQPEIKARLREAKSIFLS